MAPRLEWTDEAGNPLASFDFPVTGPGVTRTLTLKCRNAGDAAANNAALEIGAVGGLDMEAWVSGAVTGTDGTAIHAAPLPLGTIAPADELTITLTLKVPPDAPLNSRPVMALCQITYDQVG